MKISKDVKEGIFDILRIVFGLPLMAAGFILMVLVSMAILFGIPFLLMSSGNNIVHTVGIIWAFLSMFGFFGYILVMMES